MVAETNYAARQSCRLLGESKMKKVTCVLAILAAASTAALAKDLKQDKKAPAPAVSATQMTDSEMDKVTAGNNGANGGGTGYGGGHGNNLGRGADRNNFHARF